MHLHDSDKSNYKPEEVHELRMKKNIFYKSELTNMCWVYHIKLKKYISNENIEMSNISNIQSKKCLT